ncbi:anion transporter 3 [Populus alba x Populus x berolinensis]|uniref:Anion transporter 3 n=1 Tax=Populus alba x Populus x berolinensis TaxID=444605 RepID=A0AAD6QM35_9ROSI|nr:anion transporter 3 [Populus alba x Populus x berolinensis]
MCSTIGFIGPGVFIALLKIMPRHRWLQLFNDISTELELSQQAGFLLNMQDIAPQHAGFLHGIASSAGTLAATISAIGTGYFVQWSGSSQAFLRVTAGLYFVTAIFWNLFATGERVF